MKELQEIAPALLVESVDIFYNFLQPTSEEMNPASDKYTSLATLGALAHYITWGLPSTFTK